MAMRTLRILEAGNGWVLEDTGSLSSGARRFVAKEVEEVLALVEKWIWQAEEFDEVKEEEGKWAL